MRLWFPSREGLASIHLALRFAQTERCVSSRPLSCQCLVGRASCQLESEEKGLGAGERTFRGICDSCREPYVSQDTSLYFQHLPSCSPFTSLSTPSNASRHNRASNPHHQRKTTQQQTHKSQFHPPNSPPKSTSTDSAAAASCPVSSSSTRERAPSRWVPFSFLPREFCWCSADSRSLAPAAGGADSEYWRFERGESGGGSVQCKGGGMKSHTASFPPVRTFELCSAERWLGILAESVVLPRSVPRIYDVGEALEPRGICGHNSSEL